MKIHFELHGDCLRVQIRGRIEEAQCHCLEHFFARHVHDQQVVEIDLREVEAIDEQGQRLLAELVDERRQQGAEVTIIHPPRSG